MPAFNVRCPHCQKEGKANFAGQAEVVQINCPHCGHRTVDAALWTGEQVPRSAGFRGGAALGSWMAVGERRHKSFLEVHGAGLRHRHGHDVRRGRRLDFGASFKRPAAARVAILSENGG